MLSQDNNRKNAYTGAIVIADNPECPEVLQIKGTILEITELSIGGEFSYVATILPDKEFRELPEVKANNHYGLINYFGPY